MLISKKELSEAGFAAARPETFRSRPVQLRDGKHANIWIHQETGHGILERKFWEDPRYYERAYRDEYGPELDCPTSPADRLEIYRKLNDKQFATFRHMIDSDTRLLEIGAGAGGMLSRAIESGAAMVHGVEPSRHDAEFIRHTMPGAHVYNDVFHEAELGPNAYDVVVSLEVLEHVASPRAFLTRCHEVLAPGGRLHLEVPNFDDALLSSYRCDAYENFFYHKAHIHYFTAASLARLCEECGFEGEVSSFLMYPFFNHVWWHQHGAPQESAVTAMATPRPSVDSPRGQAIGAFYSRVEAEYERLLNEHMIGDCLVFQGEAVQEGG